MMIPTDVLGAAKEEPPTPRQAEVLDALEALFLTEGFREVTVEELARRLCCSRRTLYLLAPTKEEIFMRVLDGFLARLRRKGWEGAAAAATPDAAVGAYLLPAIEAASRISALMLRDLDAHQPARDIWVRHHRERMEGLRTLVDACVRQNIFRGVDSYLVAEVLSAGVRRVLEPDFLAASGLSLGEAVAELYALFLHGLLRS